MQRFISGVIASLAYVIVQLIGRLVAGVPTLPELVMDRTVQAIPGPVFSFVLDRLLYLGKPVLFVSLILLQLAVGGVLGVLYFRWRSPLFYGALSWLAAGLIVLPLAGQAIFGGSIGIAVALLVATAAYLGVLEWLARPRAPATAQETTTEASSAPATRRIGRRELITGGALLAATVYLGERTIVTRTASASPEASTAGSSANTPAAPNPVAQVALNRSKPEFAGISPEVTPIDKFYRVSKNFVDPQVDSSTWRLKITGLVEKPLELTYDDILAMPSQTIYRTLECISNDVGGDLISNGIWTAFPLADVLNQAGIKPEATMLHFTSTDGYTENMSLTQALDPSTILAYQLNGEPLPHEHGFPLRVIGVGTYGMKNPKWLTEIEVTTQGEPGYWEQQGWTNEAIVKTMSRIDTPGRAATTKPGTILVGGVAFAGDRGIDSVEVSIDAGQSWQPAELLQPVRPNTWTRWKYVWDSVTPGGYLLAVRAKDGTGQIQTSDIADPYPDGASGYHTVSVRVLP